MDTNSKAIGQKIRAMRSKMGLTTITLAKKVRMSQAQVSRLETGCLGWRSATLIKFARVLGVEPASLLVEGKDVSKTGVIEELESAGLMPSKTLTSALKNKGFLNFMEECAKTMRAHKKNLGKMEKALR